MSSSTAQAPQASSATQDTNPTILLVPGAWHTPDIFSPLHKHLAPFPIAPTSALPSVNPTDPLSYKSSTDSDAVRVKLTELLDAGKDVVVVAHSYGAVPAAAGCAGLRTTKSPDGPSPSTPPRGRLVGLIIIAGFLVPEGVSLVAASGGRAPAWYTEDSATGIAPVPPFDTAFAGDMPKDGSVHAFAKSTLHDSASGIFHVSNGKPCWAEREFEGRVAYVKCVPNGVLPEMGQDAMLAASARMVAEARKGEGEGSEGEGLLWMTREIRGFGHFPWLWEEGGVQQTAALVKECAQVFMQKA